MRVPSSQPAIRVIYAEHDLLHSVIHGMVYLVREIVKKGVVPDLKVFRAMIFYVREYPEKIHHPKEDLFLFSRLRARTSQVDAVIAELEAQHAKGNELVAALEHALLRYELVGAPAFNAFSILVEQYSAFYRTHMRLEEDTIFPVAAQVLTPDDWKVINDAFSSNSDPLADGDVKDEMAKLFSLIANIAPPPIGVGSVLD